jgi:large subunit ribosomal protein L20
MKALRYSYINRKQKKRIFRKIWIARINAASRIEGITYSHFINNLNKAKITLNRKMLSQIAILDNSTFVKIANINQKKNN